MAANKAKKVTKMATKACPDCDQQIPVACKSCPCGFIFISRRLLNAKQTEKLPPPNLVFSSHEWKLRQMEQKTNQLHFESKHSNLLPPHCNGECFPALHLLDAWCSRVPDSKAAAKRRRTERARREKANSPLTKDLENRKRSRSESHSEQIRRRRGRPKTGPSKKHDDDKERPDKDVDVYASLSDERAFVFSVALAEINRKIINQKLIL